MCDMSSANDETGYLAKNIAFVRGEVAKAVVGYEGIVDDLLICLMSHGHILMEGVPGIAKTTLAKAFSSVMSLQYSRIQFTQDLLPADIIGHYYFNQKESRFDIRKGPVFSELVLADEINRAPPKTQSALLEAMEERQATIEGTTFKLPSDFVVIATINPIEAEGVYSLPEAQLDRFMFKSCMGYLKPEQEVQMLLKKSQGKLGMGGIAKADPALLGRLKDAAAKAYISDVLLRYISEIIQRTRNVKNLVLGASPRAGEQMLYAAKARAVIGGRDHVLPDDIKAIAPKILNHRMILSVDAEVEGADLDAIIVEIMKSVPVPKGEARDNQPPRGK